MTRALLDINVLLALLDGDQPQHDFWPCDISVLDDKVFDHTRIHGPRQVTDAYLLALAARHDGRFVTLDQSVAIAAVHEATDTHLVTL